VAFYSDQLVNADNYTLCNTGSIHQIEILEQKMAISLRTLKYIFIVLAYSAMMWFVNFLLIGMSIMAADSHDNSKSTELLLGALFYLYKIFGFPLLTIIESFNGEALLYFPAGPVLNILLLVSNSIVDSDLY
jgi:hypothetical protein